MRFNRWLSGFTLSIGLSAGSAHAAVTEDTFLLRSTGDLAELCSGAQSDPLYTAAVNFCQGFTVGVFRVLQEEDMAKLLQHIFCLPNPSAESQRAWLSRYSQVKTRHSPAYPTW